MSTDAGLDHRYGKKRRVLRNESPVTRTAGIMA